MNKHALIPLVIGLVVGLAALKMGYNYLNKIKNQGGPDYGPTEKVVIATCDIPLGTKLTDKDVTLVAMPKKFLPQNVMKETKDAIGQTLKTTLSAKMLLLQDMVGPGDGLEGVIPEGYRAVAVKVDEFTSVGGLLRPGTRVDVLATFNLRKPTGGTETISKLILQNIEVRAVGQQFRSEQAGTVDSAKMKLSRSVTLLVKTDQSEALQLAASTGSIRLALRSATDDKSASTKGITLSQLVPVDGMAINATNSGTFGGLLSMVGKKGLTQSLPKPDEPYRVEVMNGDRTEQIFFASASSDKRVTPEPPANNRSTDKLSPASQQDFEPMQVQAAE